MKNRFLHIEAQPGTPIRWRILNLNLQKHVSAIIPTEGRVFTHMHSYEAKHSLLLWVALWSFVVLLLVSIWKCYQPAGNSFPLWFPIQSLPPCCFLFVPGSRLMPTFQRSTPHRFKSSICFKWPSKLTLRFKYLFTARFSWHAGTMGGRASPEKPFFLWDWRDLWD